MGKNFGGSLARLAVLALVAVGGGLLQQRVLDRHVDRVVIRAPVSEAGDGSVSRAQIEEFEAAIEACEATDARCIVYITFGEVIQHAALMERPPE